MAHRPIAERFFGAYARRDWCTMRGLLTPSVLWYFPGTASVSGLASGREEVIVRAQTISIGHSSVQLEAVLEGSDGFAIVLENSVRHGHGQHLEQNVVLSAKVTEHLVSEIRTFVSDPEAVSQFFTPVFNEWR